MTLEITPTELRKNVYKLLDQVLKSGEPIRVKRAGKHLIISAADPASRLGNLENHPDCIVGDPDDLVHMDWSQGWNPKDSNIHQHYSHAAW